MHNGSFDSDLVEWCTIVYSPKALEQPLDLVGLEGIKDLHAGYRSGSHLHSPFTWLNRRTNLLIPRPNGSPYVARDIRYADELQSLGAALEGL